MRMWGVPTNLLCRQHLLGEHNELHMLVGSIRRGRSIHGFTSTGLVDTRAIISRHNEVVMEMMRRGYNHASPLPQFSVAVAVVGYIDVEKNLKELQRRCRACCVRIESATDFRGPDNVPIKTYRTF
jgi:hypothetical protein